MMQQEKHLDGLNLAKDRAERDERIYAFYVENRNVRGYMGKLVEATGLHRSQVWRIIAAQAEKAGEAPAA